MFGLYSYYLGMKGKGSVGCLGMFYSDTSSQSGLGPDFRNLPPTDSTSWQDTNTGPVVSPSGTQSIRIQCFSNGAAGAIDQIYLSQGASTGFGG